ncbi:MAG: hypothetical protein ACRERR_14695 [Moraxellaceae bacterium]
MKISQVFAALLFATAAPAHAGTTDWRYSVGVHDFNVPDVSSHTYGLNGSIAGDQRSDNGQHFFGSFDIFWDNDKDHLDADHVPVWWQLHLGSDGDFWHDSEMHAGWTADLNTRMNTVSSVERQITALPALVAGYDSNVFQASLQAGPGWFFLEIDDDAPKEQGYTRAGLRDSTFATAVTAKAALRLGESWAISGMARHWQDSGQTLESQYQVVLRGDLSALMTGFALKQTALVLSADFYEYNLDIYKQPGLPPILLWNNDVMIRAALESKW